MRNPLAALMIAGTALAIAAALTVPAPRPGAASPVASGQSAEWEKQRTPTQFALYGIDFVDDVHGWAVGGEGRDNEKDAAIRTTDGGATWAHMNIPGARRLQAVSFVDRTTGWVVGDFGQLYRTRDGGGSWTPLEPGTTIRLTSVIFLDEQTGWMTGRDTVMFKTVDGGDTWQTFETDAKGHLSRVFFLDAQLGWALGGDGELLHSSDGGRTWDFQEIPPKVRQYGIFFADPLNGWTVGSDIFGTSDGGATWPEQHEARKSQRDVEFADARTGWSVGDEGVVLYTKDAGESWKEDSPEFNRNALNGLSIDGRAHLWACGIKGTILHRFDAAAAVTPTATATDTPTPTNTPTPAPTGTPSGPWLEIGDPTELLLVPPGRQQRVLATFGNMPTTILITGTLVGPAVFQDGEPQFTDTILRLSGAGEYPFVVKAADHAAAGETFQLQLDMHTSTARRIGAIAWSALMPAAMR
jgi:photosystem II stability/assembly factor-like uncharacterized protein